MGQSHESIREKKCLKSKRISAATAIVSMACRFPDADEPWQFWSNLKNGVNPIRQIPPARWDTSRADTSVKWCGQINGIGNFDYKFFNVSPREARAMDPQQRRQEIWHCVKDFAISLAGQIDTS